MIAETKSKPTNRIKKLPPISAETTEATFVTANEILSIPTNQILRHPSNRTIDPKSIEDLAESIQEHGQRDAARVRRIGKDGDGDTYQLLSGERRWHACKKAGLMLRCIVVVCDDATALAEVALGNAARKDLDAIERAELLEQLVRGRKEGGAGLDRLSAGKYFGLQSESGVKNAIRLLKLPESIRIFLRSGVLPERAARKLIPYCDAKPIIEAIAKDVAKVIKAEPNLDLNWEFMEVIQSLTDTGTPHWMEDLIRETTRPWDKTEREYVGYQKGYRQRGFEPNAEEKANLAIFDLPATRRSEAGVWQRCLNTKLWDSLNAPFADLANEKPNPKPVPSAKGKQKSVELSAKEKIADEKRRAKESEDRLNQFTSEWSCRMLRCLMANEADDKAVLLTLPWLVSECNDLRSFAFAATEEAGLAIKDRANCLASLANVSDSATSYEVSRNLWSLLLWPVSQVGTKPRSNVIVPNGTLPDRLPGFFGRDKILRLANICGASIESAWKQAAEDDNDYRRLVLAWLNRHTKAQLHALRLELNVTEGSETMGRTELADCVLNAHRARKPLALPKRLVKVK